MTQTFWHRVGIVLLVLSVLCAALFALLQAWYSETEEELAEHRPSSADGDTVMQAAGYALGAWSILISSAYWSVLLFVAGTAFAISAVAINPYKKWKWISSTGILLQAGVLAVLAVRYGALFEILITPYL